MPYQVIFESATPEPLNTNYGININRNLPATWGRAKAGDYYGDLISFEQGLSIGIDITEEPENINIISAAVTADFPDKWIIKLAFNGVILAQTQPIDNKSIMSVGVSQFQPATLQILTAEEAGEPPPELTIADIDAALADPSPPAERAPEVETPDIPFPFGWLKPVLQWADGIAKWWDSRQTIEAEDRKKVIEQARDKIDEDLTDIGDILGGLGAFIANPAEFIQKAVIGTIQGVAGSKELMIGEAEKEIVLTSIKPEQFKSPEFKASVEKLRKEMTGTPDTISEFLTAIFIEPAKALFDAIEAYLLPEPPVDFDKANESRKKLFALVIDFIILSSLLDIIASAVSITIVRNIAQYARSFIIMFNFGDLVALITKPSLDIAIKEPLERGFNERFQTKKMGVSDAIEAVVKEVETLDQFKQRMRELGYPESEAQIIWDKHFIPPVLQQLLIAWRRGIVDDDRLQELFILVDLDPRFQNIWDTLKYNDPSITQARFMFETGAINEDEVEEIVKREGLIPEYVENMKNFITGFQERLWRRRYLMRLQQAYIIGIRTADELRDAVIDAKYTAGVADWIIRDSDLRIEISRARRRPDKVKPLSRSQIQTLLIQRRISEQDAEQQLSDLGYSESSISIMIEQALTDREEYTEEGVKVRTLTTSQVIQALKKGLLTEAQTVERLTSLRYQEDDINILIQLASEPEEVE